MSVMVRGETTPVQLYLAAGESDQATSGHIFMDNLRTIMHGLPVDVPIMLCEDIHARFLEGDMMHRDVNDLSQKQFKAGSELIAWPGECYITGTDESGCQLSFCAVSFCTLLLCILVQSVAYATLGCGDW